MATSKLYMANPAVSCGIEQDGVILFNADTGDTAVINLTGQTLWTFTETARSVDEMANYLVKIYRGINADQAAQDAASFVESLVPDFLIQVNDET